MKKRIKDFVKKIFPKRIIEEQRVLKVVQRAHHSEQALYNRLIEENCDNDYIADQINELMKNKILEGIKKLYPDQKVYFAIPPDEETEVQYDVDSAEEDTTNEEEQTKEKPKKKKFFNFHKKKEETTQEQDEIKQLTYSGEYDDMPTEQSSGDLEKDFYEGSDGKILMIQREPKDKIYWIINALSGYRNDKHRIPNQSTSLCLVKEGQVYFSAVFDWYEKNFYYAVKGQGAYMNGKKIRVSQTEALDKSIIAFRIGSRGLSDNIELQKALTPLTLSMQSFCNVAIEMCQVASGKIDGCVDVAVSDLLNYKFSNDKTIRFFSTNFEDSNNIIVTNGIIHSKVIATVRSKLVSSSLKKVWKITKTAIKLVTAII